MLPQKTDMDNLWAYLKNIWTKAEQSSPSQPLIHELIERSKEEKEDYEYWKRTLVLRRLLDWVKNQFSIHQLQPQHTDETVDFLNTPSSKGFVVHFHETRYSKRDAVHFFDYLKERVLELGYRSQISDRRSYNRPDWVEMVERHYLKPGPVFNTTLSPGEKHQQRYGNIMLELEWRNDKIYNLRFRANSYRDRLFEEADDFQELMQLITK